MLNCMRSLYIFRYIILYVVSIYYGLYIEGNISGFSNLVK